MSGSTYSYAYHSLGELVAVPAKPHRIVPLSQACNAWIDWYESTEVP